MSDTATHNPAPDSDFVIRVDLTEHGMQGRSEQLWAKQVAPTRFVLRSLPFFAYGLRPGDEIETDDRYIVRHVTRASGHQLLRIAATAEHAGGIHAELHPLLEQLSLRHEWHRVGYVAVELTSQYVPKMLLSYLESKMQEGSLHFELA